jgi:hypothetical protein
LATVGDVRTCGRGSRNTKAKQWDETKVLVMGGVVQVICTFFDELCTIASFCSYWSELLELLGAFANKGSEEVVLCSIHSTKTLLVTLGDNAAFHPT